MHSTEQTRKGEVFFKYMSAENMVALFRSCIRAVDSQSVNASLLFLFSDGHSLSVVIDNK